MTDNCPTCCHGPVTPRISRSVGTQLTDTYRCPACGIGWTTRRYAPAYEDPSPAAREQPAA